MQAVRWCVLTHLYIRHKRSAMRRTCTPTCLQAGAYICVCVRGPRRVRRRAWWAAAAATRSP
jgi:hypothetical protein